MKKLTQRKKQLKHAHDSSWNRLMQTKKTWSLYSIQLLLIWRCVTGIVVDVGLLGEVRFGFSFFGDDSSEQEDDKSEKMEDVVEPSEICVGCNIFLNKMFGW